MQRQGRSTISAIPATTATTISEHQSEPRVEQAGGDGKSNGVVTGCPPQVLVHLAEGPAADLDGDRHVSYFLGLDSRENLPQTILAGDRNVFGGNGGVEPSWSLYLGNSIDAAWEKTIHVNKGNLALSDGSVQQLTTERLREAIANTGFQPNRLLMP